MCTIDEMMVNAPNVTLPRAAKKPQSTSKGYVGENFVRGYHVLTPNLPKLAVLPQIMDLTKAPAVAEGAGEDTRQRVCR